MIYAKYEFDIVPSVLKRLKNADVVIIGYLVKVEGEYDEVGEVIAEPIMSDKIAIDVLYHSDVLVEIETYRVYPKSPKHFIGGQQKLYFSTIPNEN